MILQLCSVGAFAAETNSRTFSEERLSDEILEDSCFYKLPDMYSNIVSVEKTDLEGEALRGCVSAYSDGNVPIECSATINKIVYVASPASKAVDGHVRKEDCKTVYILRGTTKTTSNSATSHGVTLKGSIVWIDNFGLFNELLYVYGQRYGRIAGSGYYSITNSSLGLGGGYFDYTFNSTGNNNNHTGTTFHLNVSSPATDGSNVRLSLINSMFS